MKRLATSCVLASLVALVGCSQERGPRTMRAWGDVSFNGKPIEAGAISFEPVDDAPPAQGTIKDGQFDIPADSGPVAGKTYLIKVYASKKTGKTIPNIMGDGAPTMDVLVETIPAMFNVKSTMKKTIASEADQNQFHLKLMPSGSYE